MLAECQLGVYEHAQVTYDGWRPDDVTPTDKLRSTPASHLVKTCWRREDEGGCRARWRSVFPSFSFSRRDAHQSLMAATHRSTVFLALCASATGADANSCLSSAKMWYWTWWCALKTMTTYSEYEINWTRPSTVCLWNTARDRNRCRLFAVDDLRPVIQIWVEVGTTSWQVLPLETNVGEHRVGCRGRLCRMRRWDRLGQGRWPCPHQRRGWYQYGRSRRRSQWSDVVGMLTVSPETARDLQHVQLVHVTDPKI